MTNRLQELRKHGQSVWYDNIRRGMLKSGELQKLIDMGVTGLTSNPTIFEKAIAGGTDYDDALEELARAGKSASEIYETLAIEDIQAVADLLRPIYDQTDGDDGFASLEVSPHLAHDTQATIAEARRLFSSLDRPNVMVKVPATPEGVPAIRKLIGEGINVNVTLTFSLEAYRQVREAYVQGLEDLVDSGGDVSGVASVASFFVSRVDTAVDARLDDLIIQGREELQDLQGKAAIANAKLAYRDFKETFSDERFGALRQKGARVQRPLWASTSTKNPSYSDVMYVDSLIGPDTVNTMPEATVTAFLDHGTVENTLEQGVEQAEADLQAIENAGISMEEVTAKLLADGVKAFADSFDKLLSNIEEKKDQLLTGEHDHPGTAIGDYLTDVEACIADLQQRNITYRIWHKDYTVWAPYPDEIKNRLGWLTVTDTMSEKLDTLKSFAEDVRAAGFKHVVLMGMGGSSLGPEVLRQTFGSADGYPEILVLDSTVPEWVTEVTGTIDPAWTLFLFSSKSGGTVEPNMLYRHFRTLVEQTVGTDSAGRHFAAITDPNTSLEVLAKRDGFRKVFRNPTDLGGRYSVLSYFGLVPAALSGLDVAKLLDRADTMREGCASVMPVHDNPGAWLGSIVGTLAMRGRDKLTLIASPSIASFGLWVEQLIAESTGKDGKGIVPVAGEPLEGPEYYGSDRQFVYLRLAGDDNAEADAAINQLMSSGQPVVRLDLRDKYDLGAEFFRWEFATAVVGAILGVHPFNQPDVQRSKDLTDQVLEEYRTSGTLLTTKDPEASLSSMLAQAPTGGYLAIMAYLRQTPEVDAAFDELRSQVMKRHNLATTLGYGPRFLHSTGQLHKGGPRSGLFLQVTTDHPDDLPIPGEDFSFGVLADAQARGDLQALRSNGRRVAQLHLRSGEASELREAVQEAYRP